MDRRPLGSTYRLQLHGVGLAGARRVVPYLDHLGVETLYVSPILAAVPGSTHGYDVVDPSRLDPSLGADDDLEALLDELAAHRMRLLVDIVPNHMAAARQNRWWWDVLARGRASPFAGAFDVDWEACGGKVVLGVLGAPLSDVLGGGELTVVAEDGAAALAYGDQRFPIDPASHVGSPTALAGDCADPVVLATLLERQHFRLVYWRLAARLGNYRRFFDIEGLVGVRVEAPAVYRATHHRLLELVADRRLAGLRVDHVDGLADPAGYLGALRADVDRCRHDRAVVLVEKILARDEQVPEGWATDGTTGYEFADLAGGLLVDGDGATALRADGKDGDADELALEAKREVQHRLFSGQVARLAQAATAAADATVGGAVGSVDLAPGDMEAAVVELTAQLDVYRTYLAADARGPASSDRRRLVAAAGRAEAHLEPEGRRALRLLVEGMLGETGSVGVGVGVGDGPGSVAGGPRLPAGRLPGELAAAVWLPVTSRWQQHTVAVAAKGVEDTASYRFDGLLAAAEVGGEPARPAVEPERFHRAMTRRAVRSPGSLNATTTHDTKRSEDVRARLAVLSEAPGRWQEQLRAWHGRHGDLVGAARPARHGAVPARRLERRLDGRDERFVYQTLLGTWPPLRADRRSFADRVEGYLVKAAREAKRRTSWTEPDHTYERALRHLVDGLLRPLDGPMGHDLDRWLDDIGPAAVANSLALLVLKSTAPGVPDLYQGTERWALSLVDPDNRRPVDFSALDRQLTALEGPLSGGGGLAEILVDWRDGRVKLAVTAALLRFRRSEPAIFDRGRYLPLVPYGPAAAHLVAFARQHRRRWAVVVVPRLSYRLAGPSAFPVGADCWHRTGVELPEDAPPVLTDVLGGDRWAVRRHRLEAGRVLGSFPVSVLVG